MLGGKNRKADHVTVREFGKMERLEHKSLAAFDRGDVFRAMELGKQAQAIHDRAIAGHKQNFPGAARYRDS
jgi:hypothetical protein